MFYMHTDTVTSSPHSKAVDFAIKREQRLDSILVSKCDKFPQHDGSSWITAVSVMMLLNMSEYYKTHIYSWFISMYGHTSVNEDVRISDTINVAEICCWPAHIENKSERIWSVWRRVGFPKKVAGSPETKAFLYRVCAFFLSSCPIRTKDRNWHVVEAAVKRKTRQSQ